ncbi:MAG: hypothetical protein BA865_00230 [Desulfobacterales bacterium S5133MH4]|nr:MAG: hypothetical protein BA865_00230 [Desulfobacterales bacterium S5133MH4]
MQIEWRIEKKRGNLRPKLHYKMILEECEKDLAIPPVCVESMIPKPLDHWQSHCYPGQKERNGWKPEEYYSLFTPGHKTPEVAETICLPWRADNEYPEIETSFHRLRDDFEESLRHAYNSLPMDTKGNMGITPQTKKHIAPGIAAARLLRAVGR